VSGARGPAAAAGAVVLAAILAAAVVPEWRTAGGKRRLREGQDLLIRAAQEKDEVRAAVLRDAEEVLEDAARKLPHDVRPPYLLGSAALLRGDAAAALDRYGRSLAIEERPETDLNLCRAHMAAGDGETAAADALRAIWLAPDLLRDLPASVRGAVRRELKRREGQLARGIVRIPPLPPEPGVPAR